MKTRSHDKAAACRFGSTGVPPVPAGVPTGGPRDASTRRCVIATRLVDDSAGRRAGQAGRLCYSRRRCAARAWLRTSSLLIACVLIALVPLASGQSSRKKGNRNGAAATPEPVPETGFGLFRMVRLKNIFDPDRRPMPTEGAAKPTPVLSSGNRSSYLVLTGTMVTETKRLAFFSGSHSEYNRVVQAHEKVGDCEVESISTSHVDLKRGEEPIVLAVGKQLTLGDRSAGGETAVVSATPTPTADAPASVSSPAAPDGVPSATPAPPVGDPLDSNDIMRRMMERRRKETK